MNALGKMGWGGTTVLNVQRLIALWLAVATMVAAAGPVSVWGDPLRQSADSQAPAARQRSDEQTGRQAAELSPAERRQLADVVRRAFLATHDGWSADEVVLNDQLNGKFLDACRRQMPEASPLDCNWTLLNLRKAGRLGAVATRRRHDRHDTYLHAAEIAARLMQDRYGLSIDRVLCDPRRRAEFDKTARSIAPDVEPYRLRKAALRLRKNRQLRPELVVRIADWGRQLLTFPADQLVRQPELIPHRPGVYIVRDDTGYLYIGESADLHRRVTKHLDQSDRQSLARYLSQHGTGKITVELHVFDPDSKARSVMVRRAYESELIRSRRPRLNIAP